MSIQIAAFLALEKNEEVLIWPRIRNRPPIAFLYHFETILEFLLFIEISNAKVVNTEI